MKEATVEKLMEVGDRKRDNKEIIKGWLKDFRKREGREPEESEIDAVREELEERKKLQLEYAVLKANVIRQN